MLYTATIEKIYPNQGLIVKVPINDTSYISNKNIRECSVIINDDRNISAKQRRLIYLLIHHITKFISDPPQNKINQEEKYMLDSLKLSYLIDKSDSEEIRYMLTYNYCDIVGIDIFSLSNIDMATANDFINYLISICIENGIPTNIPLHELTSDLRHYTYASVINRKCLVCQKSNADIHHSDIKIGMGRDRNKIIHEGMYVQSLCRAHHTECHSMAQDDFNNRYHIISIKLDKTLCDVLGLRSEAT